jgi:Fe-S cluster assembly ATPase SufC
MSGQGNKYLQQREEREEINILPFVSHSPTKERNTFNKRKRELQQRGVKEKFSGGGKRENNG